MPGFYFDQKKGWGDRTDAVDGVRDGSSDGVPSAAGPGCVGAALGIGAVESHARFGVT